MLKRLTDYDKILPINELYTAVQAEGSRAGYPTVVIRTTGCTHRCYFGEGGWCDAWYSSIHPEKGQYSFNDIIQMYEDNPHITEMMITGGAPTMQPVLINELMHFANSRNIFVTLETEGSHFVQTDYPIDLVSISPKFSNSVPEIGVTTPQGAIVDERMITQHNKFRLNHVAISQMIQYHADYHIKPVINPIEQPKIWNEVKSFLDDLQIPNEKVWIMPPGDNREELERVYPMVMNWVRDNGYRFTGRPHIIAFGTERRV